MSGDGSWATGGAPADGSWATQGAPGNGSWAVTGGEPQHDHDIAHGSGDPFGFKRAKEAQGGVLSALGSKIMELADKPIRAITDASQALERPIGALGAGRDAKTALKRTVDSSHQDEDDTAGVARIHDAMQKLPWWARGAMRTHPLGAAMLDMGAPTDDKTLTGRLAHGAQKLGYEIGADPATYVPGLDLLSIGGKAVKALGRIPAIAHAAEDATMGLRADSQLVRDATPRTRAVVQQAEIAAHNMRVATQERQAKLLEEHRTRLNAQHIFVAPDGSVGTRSGITPEVRRELQLDAWLNGTKDVRAALLKDGFVPDEHEAIAPLLNIQTKYKSNYEPHVKTFADEFDPAHRYVADDTFGPNKAQLGVSPDSPLADRVARRLQIGFNARHNALTDKGRGDLYQQRFVLDELKRDAGLGDRVTTSGLELRLQHEPSPAMRERIAQEIALRNESKKVWDQKWQALWSERGQKGEQHRTTLPGSPDYNHIDNVVDAMVTGLDVNHPDFAAVSRAAAKERGEVTLPAAMAARLMTPRSAAFGQNFLESMSDAARRALFVVPFAHMKNIATLQYEGEGGAAALGRGAQLYAGRKSNLSDWNARKEELQHMGATVEFANEPVARAEKGANALTKAGNAYDRFSSWTRKPANGMLWDWDLAQRMALHEHLMQTSDAYKQMSKYERGAAINSTLFNYYHKSDIAKTLEKWGAPFPHWRVGNVDRQARQLANDPRRIEAYARAQSVLNRAIFPAGPNGYTYDVNPGTPIDEGVKAVFRPWSYLASTIGGPFGDQMRQPMTMQERLQGPALGSMAQEMTAAYMPGGSIIPTAIDAVGAHDLGQALGSDRFHGQAPAALRGALGLVGGYTDQSPSWHKARIRELLAEHHDWTRYDAEKELTHEAYSRKR